MVRAPRGHDVTGASVGEGRTWRGVDVALPVRVQGSRSLELEDPWAGHSIVADQLVERDGPGASSVAEPALGEQGNDPVVLEDCLDRWTLDMLDEELRRPLPQIDLWD
jgi:hypothetical protein